MPTPADSYVVRAVTLNGATSVEISVHAHHPKRGRVPTGKRVRIRPAALLDVAMLLIEAHSAIRGSVPVEGRR